jgi:hypothetical protein
MIESFTDLCNMFFDVFKVYYKIMNLRADDLRTHCIRMPVQTPAFRVIRYEMAR